MRYLKTLIMRKHTIILSIILGIIILGSPFAISKSVFLDEGEKTPELKVENRQVSLDLSDLKGKYVLLDFWSSADADSRLKSNEYNALDWDKDGELPARISVNFDKSERLFNEIVSRDHLDKETQFHVDGADADHIKQAFNLKNEFKSYLISPEGKILAVNPAPEEIGRRFNI